MDPIRQSPVSLVTFAASSAGFWLPLIDKAPAGSQLVVIADSDAIDCPKHPRLRLIRHAQPLGLGACVQTALWEITTPLVFFVPSDNSLSLEQAHEFFDHIDKAHLVAGCRGAGRVPAAIVLWDMAKSILTRILLGHAFEPRSAWPGPTSWRRCVAHRLFGMPLSDPECGVLLVRIEIFRGLPIQSRGPFTWIELLAKANHLGCLMDEVAIGSAPRSADGFGRDAWRLFRHPEFGAARPPVVES